MPVTPYLHITSPEKRSGKTLLLDVLSLIAAEPWYTSRVTPAVLVRRIARDQPTLLLDETDAAFKADKEYAETLRGVLNGGYRKGGVASMCVKQKGDFDLVDFPVFCPKALAGIGKLPDTVEDRSIRIELRRKASSEKTERFRQRDVREETIALQRQLEHWAKGSLSVLQGARPDIPEFLDDRAADCWEPLLAIAEMAGHGWLERALTSAKSLSVGNGRDDDSVGVKLLSDIQRVFHDLDKDKVRSADLVTALVALEESPWGDLNGKPLDIRRLAKLLKPFSIVPKDIRFGDGTRKGYLCSGFEDSWMRYVPLEGATRATQEEPDSYDVADVALVAANRGTSIEVFEEGNIE